MTDKKIKIWQNDKNIHSYIRPYLIDCDTPRPAVLILPGGGYNIVCEPSEGAPVAKKFNSLGIHAFVLNYRAAPDIFPAAQTDAMRALRIIRANAEKWRINANAVGVCGFSAGGHLSVSLGSDMVDNIQALGNDEYDSYRRRPDFIIAGQGVLTFRDCKIGSIETAGYLLGKKNLSETELDSIAPDLHVNNSTPPTFLWHTFSDQVVDYRASIYLAQELRKHEVPCELHIFPQGDHGILLGVNTPDVSQWPELAARFIATQTAEKKTPPECYTHIYQCDITGTYPGKLREKN